jgi:two-component system chemotaxis response regulator CheY
MNDNKFALVIDDSVAMRQNVMSILSSLRQNGDIGEILEAENPDHALRLLLQQDGKLQFIVSGWNMPGMPLAEFLKVIQFQPRLAGAPVLLLTEEGNQAAKAVAKEVGATAVLTKPLDPERLLVLTMAVTGTVDRRRAKRITPFIACETELQFSKAKKISSAVVVNISDTGILLRTPVPPRGVGYVYDIATLVLRPAEGEPINVSARILRIEAETKGSDSEKKILMAFEYQQMDVGVRKLLMQYLQINDPETVADVKQ